MLAALILRYPWLGVAVFMLFAVLPVVMGVGAARDYLAFRRAPVAMDGAELHGALPRDRRVALSGVTWDCDDELIPPDNVQRVIYTPGTARDGTRIFAERSLFSPVSCRYLHEAPLVGFVHPLAPGLASTFEAAGVPTQSERGGPIAIDTTVTSATSVTELQIAGGITLTLVACASLFLWMALTRRKVFVRVAWVDT
jgi:hypothetical protein